MNRLPRLLPVLLLLAALPASGADSLLGQPAREWHLDHWLNSKPLKLADLKGKVVLIRWWTAPGCPYCAATAPALNEFHETYTGRGLVVIGAYHHKSSEPLKVPEVAQRAARFGFKFPVAIDPDWRTVNDWWLDHDERRWTSVSFLIDRQGRIRHIHEGGEYPPGSQDYEIMKKKIAELLDES